MPYPLNMYSKSEFGQVLLRSLSQIKAAIEIPIMANTKKCMAFNLDVLD